MSSLITGDEIMVLTHALGSWITNPATDHGCGTRCGAPDPRAEWLHPYSALPGLLSTAEKKQCCAQLGDKVFQSHLG